MEVQETEKGKRAIAAFPKHIRETAQLELQAGFVVGVIQRYRIELSSEKRTQEQIEEALIKEGLKFEREPKLSPSDIPDFLMTETGLAIEVKIKGARKRSVLRQLERYASHERVRGLLLVTNLSMGLPASISAKPAWYASLGRGWI